MKKVFLTLALVSAIGFANAQDMMSKKGTPILPEADDWSIGFDANFIFNYLGNVFHGNNTTNAPLASYVQNQTIVGKMMKDANTAYVGAVRIGNQSTKTTASVFDETATTNPFAQVNDTKTNTNMNITLAAGIQKYRGKGRLKGVYGAGVGINIASNKDEYTYGNAINSTYNAVTSTNTHDFLNGIDNTSNLNAGAGTRATEVKGGSTFGFGVRGWIGVEYFFAPKMSIGAQYGWAIAINSIGQPTRTDEKWDGTKSADVTNSYNNGNKTSLFYIDVDNLGGQIMLSCYF